MATKEHRRQAKGLIEELECRVHAGPPVGPAEIASAREFLEQSEFSRSSDYYDRLSRLQYKLQARSTQLLPPSGKRNYGGEAAGYWMQIQSAYDHLILSTCYDGEFNSQQGRIKLSHRLNQEGRIDFVELKFLQSLHPSLTGAFRKLLTVRDYQTLRKDWISADAFVLEVLPRELIFLFEDIFRCERAELLAWLINIGHNLVGDLLNEIRTAALHGRICQTGQTPAQLSLDEIQGDSVAFPILEKASALESTVEVQLAKSAIVRYHTRKLTR